MAALSLTSGEPIARWLWYWRDEYEEAQEQLEIEKAEGGLPVDAMQELDQARTWYALLSAIKGRRVRRTLVR